MRTGVRKEGVASLPDKRLEVAVQEKPEGGKANTRVIELVARHFKVPISSVRITRGHTTPSKLLTISLQ